MNYACLYLYKKRLVQHSITLSVWLFENSYIEYAFIVSGPGFCLFIYLFIYIFIIFVGGQISVPEYKKETPPNQTT